MPTGLDVLMAGDQTSSGGNGLDVLMQGGTPPTLPTINKDYAAGRAKPGYLQGLASVANGPLMGFADEIGGAIGGAIDSLKPSNTKSLTDNYRANRDTLRGMQDQQREENPITTGITQTMASAPLALIGGAAAAAPKVTGLLANTGRAMLTGLGYGALGGAGNSTADTAGGVAADTAKGAVAGAATGGALTMVPGAMGAVARNVGQRWSDSQAADYARQKVAEALSRDARGNVFTSGASNPLGQVAARFNTLPDEARLVDAGGSNTRQLLDTLSTLPGRTKETVFNAQRERQAGVGDRLRSSAEDALGTQGQRLNTTVDSLIQQRQQAAAPLYSQLRQVNVNPTQDLTAIVSAADDLGAVSVGRDIARARLQPFSIDAKAPAQWNMGQLDHVKQGLDQLLTSRKAVNPDGAYTPFGNALLELKGKLVNELDMLTTNPRTGQSLYGQAREAFAGPSALIDAANRGRSALTRDDSAIQAMTQGMGPNEMQAFRIGAFEALRNKLGTQGGQTEIMNMWKNPSTQEKLQSIFGSERAYRQFAADVAKEGVLKRMQGVGVGSQTAARAAGMGDLDMSALSDVGHAAAAAKTGNVLGALGAVQSAWGRVSTPQPVRDQMGGLLMSRGPQAAQNLNGMDQLIQQINQRNATQAGTMGLLGSQIGSRLASPLLGY
jgi:hypothetical protein